MRAALLNVVSVVSLALAEKAQPPGAPGRVVFVCEHGTVKSLIAREWFNRRAAQRGLEVRAVSRGVMLDPSVPPAIAEALRRDGFDVRGFEARPFTAADLGGTLRVIAIGALPEFAKGRGEVPLETWDGIPPASESYAASRDALRARIEALLEALERQGRRP